MHTETYCATLGSMSRVAAIRAIHQAWLQLTALSANVDCEHFDNAPAIQSLAAALRDAGHPGFES